MGSAHEPAGRRRRRVWHFHICASACLRSGSCLRLSVSVRRAVPAPAGRRPALEGGQALVAGRGPATEGAGTAVAGRGTQRGHDGAITRAHCAPLWSAARQVAAAAAALRDGRESRRQRPARLLSAQSCVTSPRPAARCFLAGATRRRLHRVEWKFRARSAPDSRANGHAGRLTAGHLSRLAGTDMRRRLGDIQAGTLSPASRKRVERRRAGRMSRRNKTLTKLDDPARAGQAAVTLYRRLH